MLKLAGAGGNAVNNRARSSGTKTTCADPPPGKRQALMEGREMGIDLCTQAPKPRVAMTPHAVSVWKHVKNLVQKIAGYIGAQLKLSRREQCNEHLCLSIDGSDTYTRIHELDTCRELSG